MKAAIYLIRSSGLTKIGFSKNPWRRYKQLCTGSPNNMALVFTLYCENAPAVERELHEIFKDRRVNGEWFRVSVDEVLITLGEKAMSRMPNPKAEKEEDQNPIDGDDIEATDEELRSFFTNMSEMTEEQTEKYNEH